MLTLRFREVLHGSYYLLADPRDERTAELWLEVVADAMPRTALVRTATVSGELRFDRFAKGAVSGTLELVPDERRASYALDFEGDEGAPYRLLGHRVVSWLMPIDSATLVDGNLYDAHAREIGRASLRFDLRTRLGSLLRSVRLVRKRA